MRLTPLLLLTALIACGGYVQMPPNPRIEQAADVSAALDAWETRIGPAPLCQENRDDLLWNTVSPPLFYDVCAKAPPGSMACTFVYQDGRAEITMLGDVVYTQQTLDRLRLHELTHWLMACSGRDYLGDPMHHDTFIWPYQVDAAEELL